MCSWEKGQPFGYDGVDTRVTTSREADHVQPKRWKLEHGTTRLPQQSPNAAFYARLLPTFVLSEAFKVDVSAPVVPVTAYPRKRFRTRIDIAAKIVRRRGSPPSFASTTLPAAQAAQRYRETSALQPPWRAGRTCSTAHSRCALDGCRPATGERSKVDDDKGVDQAPKFPLRRRIDRFRVPSDAKPRR